MLWLEVNDAYYGYGWGFRHFELDMKILVWIIDFRIEENYNPNQTQISSNWIEFFKFDFESLN